MSLSQRIRRWTDRTDINAIQPADLESALAALGLARASGEGTLACAACGKRLTAAEVAALKRLAGSQVVVCCSHGECLSQFAREDASR